MPKSIAEFAMLDRFLEYMKCERGRSPLTIENYRRDLQDFCKFFTSLSCELNWGTVDSDIVRDWIGWMMDRGASPASVNRRLSALRSFYHFALLRDLIQADPTYGINGPRKEKTLPYFLKEKQMRDLLDAVDWKDGFEDVRDRLIILMFYETGMRLSELLGLLDSDVDVCTFTMRVLGKRNKQRVIPFGNELAAEISRYRDVLRGKVERFSPSFFLTTKGRRMKESQVRYIVEKNLRKVSTLKKVSPHVLRHTFATEMLNHGADLESVKRLLGHSSLTTTEVYTHVTFEQLKREYKTAHPRA